MQKRHIRGRRHGFVCFSMQPFILLQHPSGTRASFKQPGTLWGCMVEHPVTLVFLTLSQGFNERAAPCERGAPPIRVTRPLSPLRPLRPLMSPLRPLRPLSPLRLLSPLRPLRPLMNPLKPLRQLRLQRRRGR